MASEDTPRDEPDYDATNYDNGEGEPRVNKRKHSTSNRSTLVVACTSSYGGSGTTTTTVHVATELKNIVFRVLVVDLDSQANTTTIMRKSYNVPLQTNAGVVDFLRHKTEHHWEKENIDHARDCIIALVSDDTGGKLDLLMASWEVDTGVMAGGSVYEDAHRTHS
jgi:Mrp family chromosome partitioning ATPase